MMARAVVGVCLSEEGGRIKIRLTGIIPNGSPHPVRWILIHIKKEQKIRKNNKKKHKK